MKAIEQYFPLALFVMLYKVVPTVESVDKILKYDHSNERYRAVLSCSAFLQCFPVVLFVLLNKVVLTFESVDEILKCGHSNESSVLSKRPCGSVCVSETKSDNDVAFTIEMVFFSLRLAVCPIMPIKVSVLCVA